MAMLPKRYIITYTTVLKFEVGKIFILLLFFFCKQEMALYNDISLFL